MTGNRFTNLQTFPLPFLTNPSHPPAILASIEYRLAPTHPDPAPVEDTHAGLLWLYTHAPTLGIDRDRITVTGVFAGGCLAAGLTTELEGIGVWDRNDNERAWRALLGEERSGSRVKGVVSEYSAPGRAEWLGVKEGMPKGVYLDVGSTDTLRDEGVEFARRLLEDGV
ncbi:alpha/beta hydrolase [Aspergillus neoniger CBS 115656]|uniref:Alpha/beta-hydrolase n=1 Tax=Aspergillus neoniger (strain CBS 115656) TaxID=1448310 RepID=A0A318YLW1_ASPNB|nr:alpha/beta-hydrolase [Aspergillus neoniger CBS 115656]PYH33350.1 alpha/beta-hydrolase [Aspergillus neoniger CBS 115656]